MISMEKDRNVQRLAASAERIGRIDGSVDTAFFETAQGSVARFALAQGKNPAKAGRDLVAAGIVGPDDPVARALQEVSPEASPASRREIMEFGLAQTGRISDETRDRDILVNAAALRRRIGQGKIEPEAIAVAFEGLARRAGESGCATTLESAGSACANVVHSCARGASRERATARRDRAGETR